MGASYPDNPAAFDPGRWHWVVHDVLPRIGMWVGRPTYVRARCWVEGFGATDDFLVGFQKWLTSGPIAWPAIIVDEIWPGRNEDDLTYPGEDAIAIDHLRRRLLDYLQADAAHDSVGAEGWSAPAAGSPPGVAPPGDRPPDGGVAGVDTGGDELHGRVLA